MQSAAKKSAALSQWTVDECLLFSSGVCEFMGVDERDAYFSGTHSGAELDLLIHRGSGKLGIEFKRTVAPKITRSMHVELADLALDELIAVHGGSDSFPMAERIRAVAASRLELDLLRVR